jgi:hypothetical protein
MMDECTTATDLYPLGKGCLSSAFSLVALSLVAFPITASSVVFLSGPSSADQLFFLSFPTFNGYFELTTAARNFYF